jgi:BirA family biotin operon repressor/biotin-[acetyl-CoA-carboxylase] ligase
VISLRAGLAVAEALQPLIPEPVQLKWPNDLMLYGRKVGGVLCEARWQGESLGWVAVGLGLNVKNLVPQELEASAVSLAALGIDLELSEIRDGIVAALRKLDLDTRELSPSELRRFARRDCLRGRGIREPISGVVQGVCADGALMVQPDTGPAVALRTGSITSAESLTAGTFDHVAHTRHR